MINIDERHKVLTHWLKTQIGKEVSLLPLLGDASFRRYFRTQLGDQKVIVMDAPPHLENTHSFVKVAKAFQQADICVPDIFKMDLDLGFLVISDFGDRLYFKELHENNAEILYFKTFEPLLRIQLCPYFEKGELPLFDQQFLLKELAFFKEWFLKVYLNLELSEELLDDTFNFLVAAATEQPQVCVHRDYHSRNLILLENDSVGILDFQDAVIGPITYDLVSLLRDCYIVWPRSKVIHWALTFYKMAKSEHASLKDVSPEQFMRWFDLMGIQRHLKAIFIFARKFKRDGVSAYLADIPRTLNYILEVSQYYPELKLFREQVETQILPKIRSKINP